MITFVQLARIGEPIKPFDIMVTIADTKDLQIDYSGRYLEEMKVGMKVTEDFKNEFYTGIVSSIAGYRATATGKQVSYVRIRLDKLPKEARVGDNVKIAIDVAKKDNILVIPSSAVHVFDNRPYVILLENGVRTERYIETGLANEMSVEVISGLKEGEEIIVN
jgi:multidrug efflux pump subunit AcrA (membrane-fusion protein)